MILLLKSSNRNFPLDFESILPEKGELRRFDSLEALIAAPERNQPFVAVLEVGSTDDLDRALVAYEWCELVQPLAAGRFILLMASKNISLGERAARFGSTEIAQLPLPARNILFKLDLQKRLLAGEKKTAPRVPAGFTPEIAPHSTKANRVLVLRGPGPPKGRWQEAPPSPSGKIRWRWVRTPETPPDEAEKLGFSWEAENPIPPKFVEKNQTWELEEAASELLCFRDGKQIFSSRELARTQEAGDNSATLVPGHYLASPELDSHTFSARTPEEPAAGVSRPKEAALLPEKKKEFSSSSADSSTFSAKGDEAATREKEKTISHRDQLLDAAEEKKFSAKEALPGKEPLSPPERKSAGERAEEAPYKKIGRTENVFGTTQLEPAELIKKELIAKEGRPAEREMGRQASTSPAPGTAGPRLSATETISGPAADSSSAPEKTAVEKKASGKTPGAPPEESVSKKIAASAAAPSSNYENLPAEAETAGETKKPNRVGEGRESEKKMAGLQPEIAEEKSLTRASAEEENAKNKLLSERENAKAADASAASLPSQSENPPAGGHGNFLGNRDSTTIEQEKSRLNIGTAAVEGKEPGESESARYRGAKAPNERETIPGRAESGAETENFLKQRYFVTMSLADLRDRDSSWHPVDQYRIYLAASQRYYGIKDPHDALPLWVYQGELAPEFLDQQKAWKFYDRHPQVYVTLESLPRPVLDHIYRAAGLTPPDPDFFVKKTPEKEVYETATGTAAKKGKPPPAPESGWGGFLQLIRKLFRL